MFTGPQLKGQAPSKRVKNYILEVNKLSKTGIYLFGQLFRIIVLLFFNLVNVVCPNYYC